jgi:hypothetical protein
MLPKREPKKCRLCEKQESDELRLEYHQSEWWNLHMGLGAYVCSGCHKTQHRKEARIAREESKQEQQED